MNTSWTGCHSITEHTQSHIHNWGSFKVSNQLKHECFWTVEGNQNFWGKPVQTQGEHRRKCPRPDWDLDLENFKS